MTPKEVGSPDSSRTGELPGGWQVVGFEGLSEGGFVS